MCRSISIEQKNCLYAQPQLRLPRFFFLLFSLSNNVSACVCSFLFIWMLEIQTNWMNPTDFLRQKRLLSFLVWVWKICAQHVAHIFKSCLSQHINFNYLCFQFYSTSTLPISRSLNSIKSLLYEEREKKRYVGMQIVYKLFTVKKMFGIQTKCVFFFSLRKRQCYSLPVAIIFTNK